MLATWLLSSEDLAFMVLVPFGRWLDALNSSEKPRVERDLFYYKNLMSFAPDNRYGLDLENANLMWGPQRINEFEEGVAAVFFNHATRVRLKKTTGDGARCTVKFASIANRSHEVKDKTITLSASQILTVGSDSFAPCWLIFKKTEERLNGEALREARRGGSFDPGWKFLDDDLCWPHRGELAQCMNLLREHRKSLCASRPPQFRPRDCV
jgi:hypothetical protein